MGKSGNERGNMKQNQVEIYPGYSVSSMEYERRYKGVDLDHFRRVMSPDLFKAYVCNIGVIEGCNIENIGEFVDYPYA